MTSTGRGDLRSPGAVIATERERRQTIYQIFGKIRDYNPITDTASVEMEGLGVIEAWFDGLKIHTALNRGLMIHNAPVTLAATDAHRLGEAVITAVGDSPGTATTTQNGITLTTKVGRGYVSTDAHGVGSSAVLFAPAYPAALVDLTAAADNHSQTSLSAISRSGFTISVNDPTTPNGYVYFSYHATGY